jgi:transcription termination factor NusB
MSLRHKSREFALQMLFEWDMTRQDPARVEKLFWTSARASAPTRKFADVLFEGTVAQAGSIGSRLLTGASCASRFMSFAAPPRRRRS